MAHIDIATNDTLWYNDGGHFTPLIKIGYTSSPDIDRRMEQLNRMTSTAGRFVKFASYEVAPIPGRMPDRLVHSIIQAINPNLRLTESKEYFIWEPESAYRFFESMARLHGCEDKLVRYDGRAADDPPRQSRTPIPPMNFRLLGIPEGATLRYRADPSITCTVCGERKVNYEGRVCSLSALAQELRGRPGAVQGTLWFTWEGRILADMWREYCAERIAASSD